MLFRTNATSLLEISFVFLLYLKVIFKIVKSADVISLMFERRMLFSTNSTTLLEIFFVFMLNSKVIFKSVKIADFICLERTS